MKKALFIVIGIVVLIFVLAFAKDIIIKISVEKGVQFVTGLPLKMESFRAGIIKTLVGIRGLRLYNPKGYKDKIMLDMPEIYVDYDLPAIMKGKVHLEEMHINVKEFVVIKNEKGELNLDSLKVVQAQKEGKKPEEKEKGKAPEIQIDSLELKIGKVLYKDYSRGGEPAVREFDVNLNEKYTNIRDPYKLVSLIVVRALMNTTIASLANFDLGGLKGTVSGALASVEKIAVETAAKTQEAAKQAVQKVGEATTDAVKKTTEGLKDVFKLPFGGSKEE
ncbi:MAG: hypothetical protein JSW18_04395 [Candidatus Omnitrophota bacterium]|nr:MAG: hypothetical protein JSW18_04395 [Candidatus Omnitrophota bacterium]